MKEVAKTGRILGRATINRHIRRVMNGRATELADKIIEKVLAGDSTAMLAATHLLIEANKGDQVAVEGKELADGDKKWRQSLVSTNCSPEEMAAFEATWNRLKVANSDKENSRAAQ